MRLRPLLERSRPDLVLASWVHPEGYAALKAAHSLGIPTVIQAVGTDLRRKWDAFARRLIRLSMTHSDAVITVSRELKQLAVRYGADPARVFPVLNGCDANVFYQRDSSEMRARLALPPDCELVVFVGNLIAAKGVNELLESLISLFPRRPKLRAAIVGSGVMQTEFSRRAASSGYSDRIRLLGGRPPWEIAEWLGASSLLCLPSYSEGCPNVVLEALASGRPVVSTNVGGIPELVNETNGILVPPQDVSSLSQALDAALDQTWNPCRIAETSRRTWHDAAAETFEVCERTWKQARGRSANTIAKERVRAVASSTR